MWKGQSYLPLSVCCSIDFCPSPYLPHIQSLSSLQLPPSPPPPRASENSHVARVPRILLESEIPATKNALYRRKTTKLGLWWSQFPAKKNPFRFRRKSTMFGLWWSQYPATNESKRHVRPLVIHEILLQTTCSVLEGRKTC